MTTIPSVDPGQLADHIASIDRDLANETGHDLHFHTGRALAEALEPRTVQRNSAYRFASERAQRTSDKYGAQTIELLAVKPTRETSK